MRPFAKLTAETALQVREAAGTQREIALRFEISKTHVCNIKNKKSSKILWNEEYNPICQSNNYHLLNLLYKYAFSRAGCQI